MKLEQSFDVDAPVDTVWRALIDVQRVAPCLPGAEILGSGDDGTYEGTFTVKIGPASASYRGKLHMEDVDESAHRAVMHANGTDKRGQGGAKATIVSVVIEHEGGSRVRVETDYTITGRLARFGRGGMIEDVSRRLLTDFATCLQETLGAGAVTGGDAPEPAVPPPAPDVAATAPEAATPQATGAEVGGGEQAARSQGSGAPAATRPSNPPPSASPAPRPSAHRPAQAKPLNALALLRSVLRDRIKALIARVRSARSG